MTPPTPEGQRVAGDDLIKDDWVTYWKAGAFGAEPSKLRARFLRYTGGGMCQIQIQTSLRKVCVRRTSIVKESTP